MASDKKISTWVPILLLILFFGLIVVATRYSVRLSAIFQIWGQGVTWDEEDVLHQTILFSSGPCAVAMLLREEGRENISVAKIAWIAGTDLDGTTPEGLITVGKYYGYSVHDEWMSYDDLIDENCSGVMFYEDENVLHMAYVRPDEDNNRIIVKDSVLGLTYVRRNQFRGYFYPDTWQVYLFE